VGGLAVDLAVLDCVRDRTIGRCICIGGTGSGYRRCEEMSRLKAKTDFLKRLGRPAVGRPHMAIGPFAPQPPTAGHEAVDLLSAGGWSR
jgi:hypothetical protein